MNSTLGTISVRCPAGCGEDFTVMLFLDAIDFGDAGCEVSTYYDEAGLDLLAAAHEELCPSLSS